MLHFCFAIEGSLHNVKHTPQATAYSGLQWPTVAYSGLQWPTVAFSGLQWPTVAYSLNFTTPRIVLF